MQILYRLISSFIYIVLWPYGRVRIMFGSKLWRDRLGLIQKNDAIDIWIHAASVGEAKIAGYLIDYLLRQRPSTRIYLSTMTTTGHKIAEQIESRQVISGYFPIDAIVSVRRTLERINPRLLVIAETEIWPNLIEQAHQKNIPVILVNGRMTAKGFKKYKLIRKMLAQVLLRYDRFFVKSHEDKERLQYFNLPEEKIIEAGDMKFDAPMLEHNPERIRKIRNRLGAKDDDLVLVAGSTRPGEETLMLELYKKMAANKSFRLVMAPRHLKRIEEVKNILALHKIEYGVYGLDNGSSPVTLVNSMGQLEELYQAADLAFVGGTLVNVGGHNLLEPVWAGTPVIFGPYLSNVSDAKEYILRNNYGAMVSTVDEMCVVIEKFTKDRTIFSIKSDQDRLPSATAKAADYILEKLKHV